jgi:hypothetical protein
VGVLFIWGYSFYLEDGFLSAVLGCVKIALTNRIEREDNIMQTLTLQVDDAVTEKFMWLLNHFSPDEVAILDSDTLVTDEAYLRGVNGMVESLHQARSEPKQQGVMLSQLDW